MSIRFMTVLLALSLLAPVALSGCKSDEEKICDHLFELAEEDGEKIDDKDRDRCSEELKKNLDKCENRDEVVDCFLELEDTKYERKCRKLCEAK